MNNLKAVAKKLGVKNCAFDGQELSYVIPLLMNIQKEGSTLFMKVDSERKKDSATIIIEGGLLGDSYLKCETDNITQGLGQLIIEYYEKFWS